MSSVESVEVLKAKLEKLQHICCKQKKQLKVSQQRARRYKSRVVRLKNILAFVKKSKFGKDGELIFESSTLQDKETEQLTIDNL